MSRLGGFHWSKTSTPGGPILDFEGTVSSPMESKLCADNRYPSCLVVYMQHVLSSIFLNANMMFVVIEFPQMTPIHHQV